MLRFPERYEQGFTLLEAVIVILIAGIVGGMVALFMRQPAQVYVDSEARSEVSDIADVAVRRMARELRLALPNSVRFTPSGGLATDTKYIEFLLTKSGGRYLAAEDFGANPVVGNILSFTDPGRLSFDIVGTMPTGAQAIAEGDFIVVNNLGPGAAPFDAYDCSGSCNRAEVQSASGVTINLKTRNPFGDLTAAGSPSGRRFQVVTTPVTYVCNPAERTLTRYSGYAIAATQPSSVPIAGATKALLAQGLTACNFSVYKYTAGNPARQRGELIGVSLTMQAAQGNGGAVTVFQQVHVDNTP